MKGVVYDRKSGKLGIRRMATKAEEKEHGCNYVVELLDPVNFERLGVYTIWGAGETGVDWHNLPKTDPRVQYIALFDIIEGGIADWYYNIVTEDQNACIDEAFIENPHAVFELIRKIFE